MNALHMIILFNIFVVFFNLIGMTIGARGRFVHWYLNRKGFWWVMGVGYAVIISVFAVRSLEWNL